LDKALEQGLFLFLAETLPGILDLKKKEYGISSIAQCWLIIVFIVAFLRTGDELYCARSFRWTSETGADRYRDIAPGAAFDEFNGVGEQVNTSETQIS